MMSKVRIIILSLAGLLLLPLLVFAKDGCTGDCASCHTLTEKEASELLKQMGGSVKSIKTAPIAGMFELLMEKDGKQGLVYIDYSKKHIMQGFILGLDNLKPVTSHVQENPQAKQATSLDPKAIPIDSAIVMGNPQGAKKLYVFTDPDCPYCRKMHAELKKLEKMDSDLAIYVLLFPLPAHPRAYDKSRAILTTKKRAVLDSVFDGKETLMLSDSRSKDTLDGIIRFASRNGIVATPSLVLSDGKVITGFIEAEELAILLRGK